MLTLNKGKENLLTGLKNRFAAEDEEDLAAKNIVGKYIEGT